MSDNNLSEELITSYAFGAATKDKIIVPVMILLAANYFAAVSNLE